MNANSHEGQIELLKQELEQMRHIVNQLQADRDKDSSRIDDLRAELSASAGRVFARPQLPEYTLEELQEMARDFEKWAEEMPPDMLPLSAFIGEIEQLAREA